MKALVLLLLALSGAHSMAGEPLEPQVQEGRETGNGGVNVAVEFVASATKAIHFVRQNQTAFPALALVDLEQILKDAEVTVVDYPLPVKKGGLIQSSTAANYKNPGRVKIYRQGWNETASEEIREALSLHEIVSLAGLEETGIYSQMQVFLSLHYQQKAEAENRRLENLSIYIVNFGIKLRDNPVYKNLTDIRLVGGEIVQVVDRYDLGEEPMVAIVTNDGEYGWTRLINLRKVTTKNIVGAETHEAVKRQLDVAIELLERKHSN